MEQNSRSKNTAYNVTIGLLSKGIMLILSFIGRKVFIHYIGIEYLGINGLFSNILSLLSLADLGFGTAMNYSFYKPLATGDKAKIAALVNFYKKMYNVIAIAVLAFGLMCLPMLPYIVNSEKVIPYLEVYYLVFLMQTVISYLFVYKSAVITADQKSYITSRITIFITTGKTIIQIISVVLFKNFLIYIIIDVLANLINNLVLSRTATVLYPNIKNNYIQLLSEEKKDIFTNLKSVFIYKLSGTLINSIDNILISTMLGVSILGYYSNYQTIITNVSQIITIIFGSVTASIGNLIITEKPAERYRIFKIMQMLSFWLSGYVTISIYILSAGFIENWLGTEFILNKTVTFAIAFNLFFSTSMQPLWSFREATGLYRQTRYIMLLAAGINLVLSIVLGKVIGLAGIIFATVLSKMLTYFWYEPHLLFQKYFEKTEFCYYKSYFINVVVILFGIIITGVVVQFVKLTGWTGWIVKAVIVSVISNLLYLLMYFRSPEFEYILTKVKKLKVLVKDRKLNALTSTTNQFQQHFDNK